MIIRTNNKRALIRESRMILKLGRENVNKVKRGFDLRIWNCRGKFRIRKDRKED
jgi:hypothetical protein